MNQTLRGGLALNRLVEDAPVDLLSHFVGIERVEEHNDEAELRAAIDGRLAEVDAVRAKKLEDAAARIRVMADAGAWALTCAAEERLEGEDAIAFSRQLDALGRSLWSFMHAVAVFDDAESVHYASRYRGYGKLYAAFEVPEPVELEWTEALRDKVAEQIVRRLDLQGCCTVSHIRLPRNGGDAARHALIVRHPGPLASIPEMLDDGRRQRHYFVPPNEATLIYSPADGMVEVCAPSPGVRQKFGTCFAVTGLGQDLSNKPITYKYYDLSRFSGSLTLPPVEVEGFSTEPPKVTEVDLRPQHPRRRLSLKVAPDDDIEEVADRLLTKGFFRRSGQIVRVVISVRYRGADDARAKTLSLCVSHPNSSNLRSLEEPSQRELASALLKEWKVLQTFQPPSASQQRALLPALIGLYALPATVVLDSDLKSRGFDVKGLARQGFIAPHGRHKVLLIEPDDAGPEEVEVDLAGEPDQMIYRGADGRTASMPSGLVEQFAINRFYVEETIADNLRPCFARWSFGRSNDNLAFLGELNLPAGSVPCYLARGLEERTVFERLDVYLRGEDRGRRGIVLDTSDSGLSFIAGHVVLPISKHLSVGSDLALDLPAISLAFDRLRRLASADGSIDLIRHDGKAATLVIPGKEPLQLMGPKQIMIFERLVEGHRCGAPFVPTSKLMEGSNARSPQNAFTTERWEQINGVYIGKVGKRSGWRLIADPA